MRRPQPRSTRQCSWTTHLGGYDLWWYQQYPWSLRFLHGVRCSRDWFVARGRRPPWEGWVEMRRPEPAGVNAENLDPKELGQLLTKLKGLREFLFSPTYDDKLTLREPGKVWVEGESGLIRFTLKEPSSCMELVSSVPRLEDLWGAIESLLVAERAPWRVDKWAMERKLSGKKKK